MTTMISSSLANFDKIKADFDYIRDFHWKKLGGNVISQMVGPKFEYLLENNFDEALRLAIKGTNYGLSRANLLMGTEKEDFLEWRETFSSALASVNLLTVRVVKLSFDKNITSLDRVLESDQFTSIFPIMSAATRLRRMYANDWLVYGGSERLEKLMDLTQERVDRVRLLYDEHSSDRDFRWIKPETFTQIESNIDEVLVIRELLKN